MKLNNEAISLPILIPSYEPNDSLLDLCKSLKASGITDIIILDDGSGEAYNHIFEQAENDFECVVLHHEKNLGKGRALKDLFVYVLENKSDAIGCVTADSDGQHLTRDIIACRDALIEHPDSLIMGCRDFSIYGIPPKSLFGNSLTRKMFRLFVGMDISDTQTGLRGIPADFMKKLICVPGERFEFETNMLMESKGKFPIKEVTITTVYKDENRHTHFSPIKDSVRIYSIFFKYIFRFAASSLLSFVIDILLFTVLCRLFQNTAGVFYITVATVGARIISSVCNYIINYKLVFKSKESFVSSSVKYYLLVVVIMMISALLTTLGVTFCGASSETIVKMIVDTGLFFVSYSIQKKIVFRVSRK